MSDEVFTEKGFDQESVVTDETGAPDVDRHEVARAMDAHVHEQNAIHKHSIEDHTQRCCPDHQTHTSGGRPHSGNCTLR